MKTLYFDIAGKPVTSSDAVVCYSDDGNLLNAFFYALGCELLSNSGIDAPKASMITEFDSPEHKREFDYIISQWHDFRSILFSDNLEGNFTVFLPKEYLHWLCNHPNQDYRVVYKIKNYDCTCDLPIDIKIKDFYNDCITDDLIHSLVNKLNEDSSIEQFVVNLNTVTKNSPIVKDLLQNTHASFVPYEKWKCPKPEAEKKQTTYFGKAEVIVLQKQYKSFGLFRSGRCLVQDPETELYGYIDEEGNEVIKCRYTEASNFSRNYAWTKYEKNSNWVVINKDNEYCSVIRLLWKKGDKKPIFHPEYGLVEAKIPDVDEINYYYYYVVPESTTKYKVKPYPAIFDYCGTLLNKQSAYYQLEDGIVSYQLGKKTQIENRNEEPGMQLSFQVRQKDGKFGVVRDEVDAIEVIIPFEFEQILDLGDGFFLLTDANNNRQLCRYKQ